MNSPCKPCKSLEDIRVEAKQEEPGALFKMIDAKTVCITTVAGKYTRTCTIGLTN